MANSQPPRKHHYIPEFYLKKWVGSDDRVCAYSRPPSSSSTQGPVKALRRHPAGTGFEIDLYSLTGLPTDARSFLETEFFKKVDQFASNALDLLADSQISRLSQDDRSGWARFIISLINRHPEKIRALREHSHGSIRAAAMETDEGRALITKHSNLENNDELLDRLIDQTADVTFAKLLTTIIDSENVGNYILQMRWSVVLIDNPIHTFLTSDRPVAMSDGINHPDSFIVMPIGPKKAFLAVNTIEMEKQIQSLPIQKFMISVNNVVARQANDFVYGVDDRQLRFVDNRLGKGPPQFIAGRVLMDAMKIAI